MAKSPSPPPPPRPPSPVPLPHPSPGQPGWGPTPAGKSAVPSSGMNPAGKTAADQNQSTRERDLAEAMKKRVEAEKALTDAIVKATAPFGALGRLAGTIATSLAQISQGSSKGGGQGGMGGMLGGKAGAAIAIAGAAKDFLQSIGDTIASAFDGVKNAIQGAGRTAQHLASNDGLGALTTAVDTAADVMGTIPIVGSAMASGMKLVSGSLNVFKGVLDSLGNRAKELSGLNPVLAQAVAETEVQKFFADMREANRNEAEYRDLIYAQAKLDREWQNAITELKKELIPWATRMAKLMTFMVKAIPKFIEELGKTNPMFAALADIGKGLDVWLKQIEQNTRKEDEDQAGLDPIQAIFNMGAFGVNVNGPPPPARPVPGAIPPILNRPMPGA